MPKKGSNFERFIAKKMSLWWTHGERDDVFWRTSQSGGRATIRKKAGKLTKNQDGDLCATDPIGQPLIDKTTIELKVGYDAWTFKELIDSKVSRKQTILESFFEQCHREAESQNKIGWMLIMKQSRREILVSINHNFWKFLTKKCCFPGTMKKIVVVHPEFGFVHCFSLQVFLEHVTPEIFL